MHPLLMDRGYWQARIDRLASAPRRLLLYSRPDLSRPGVEVTELRFRAHDGEGIWGLLARSAFRWWGPPTDLHVVDHEQDVALDWEAIEDGRADLAVKLPCRDRLEERVLDVVRAVQAVGAVRGIDAERIRLVDPDGTSVLDELLIAEQVLLKFH